MLICLVTLDLVRPRPGESQDEFAAKFRRWRVQREHGHQLRPAPHPDDLRTWRDLPGARDWDVLAALKARDGWKVLSHRREFVEEQDGPIKDEVEFAA